MRQQMDLGKDRERSDRILGTSGTTSSCRRTRTENPRRSKAIQGAVSLLAAAGCLVSQLIPDGSISDSEFFSCGSSGDEPADFGTGSSGFGVSQAGPNGSRLKTRGTTRSRPDGNVSAGSAPGASDAYTSLPRRRLRGNGSYGRLGKRELTRSFLRIGSEYNETKHAFDPDKDTHDLQYSADQLEILNETFVTTVKRGTQQHLRTAVRRRAQLNGFERQVYENAIPRNVSNEYLATEKPILTCITEPCVDEVTLLENISSMCLTHDTRSVRAFRSTLEDRIISETGFTVPRPILDSTGTAGNCHLTPNMQDGGICCPCRPMLPSRELIDCDGCPHLARDRCTGCYIINDDDYWYRPCCAEWMVPPPPPPPEPPPGPHPPDTRTDWHEALAVEINKNDSAWEPIFDFAAVKRNYSKVCPPDPKRPRFNDRKACSSVTTEEECDRRNPRCWWHPFEQQCHTSYIHDSMAEYAVEAKNAWRRCGCRMQAHDRYLSECDARWHTACDRCVREIIIDDLGTDLHKTPPEASWQQGRLNRQFGIFKYMLHKTVEANQVVGRNAMKVAEWCRTVSCPPWRPRFNDRKACSSITTEEECGRNRPRCWWQPYVEECFTSDIHDLMSTDFSVEAKDAWRCCGCRKQTLYKYFSECDACWHAACDGCIREIIIDNHDYWLCPCCRWWEVDFNNTLRDDSAAGSYPDANGSLARTLVNAVTCSPWGVPTNEDFEDPQATVDAMRRQGDAEATGLIDPDLEADDMEAHGDQDDEAADLPLVWPGSSRALDTVPERRVTRFTYHTRASVPFQHH